MKTILLIEDDPSDRAMMVSAIEAATGASVVIAETGEAGLDRLVQAAPGSAREQDALSAVFLDLSLPRAAGQDVLREIRRHASSRMIPVVIFTASHSDVDIYVSYQLGANAFVVKPGDEQEFRKAVEAAAVFWLNTNVVPVSG